ncbi:MAG: hypothetical protein ACYCW6_31475 [Candidatus Xenobia bacterium]
MIFFVSEGRLQGRLVTAADLASASNQVTVPNVRDTHGDRYMP